MTPIDLIKACFIFLVFGYFENVYALGFITSLVIGCYAAWVNTTFHILAVALIQFGLHYFHYKELSYLCFVVVDVIYVLYEPPALFSIQDNSSDMHITFKPYEKEIRNLLFQRNPSILHRVDFLLDRFKGQERDLYLELVDEYSQEKYDTPNKSVKSDRKSPKPTPPGRAYDDKDIVRPGMSNHDVENIHTAMYRARASVTKQSSLSGNSGQDPRL